jgi:hypothetical protein
MGGRHQLHDSSETHGSEGVEGEDDRKSAQEMEGI